MGLKPIAPGLRHINYNARSAAKVSLIVQPGDTLTVSDDVAEQLLRASTQFKDASTGGAPPDGAPTGEPADPGGDDPTADTTKPKRTRKG